MQFRLTLSCQPGRTLIPFNYAYRLSGFLYGVLANADEQYARFLHQEGYAVSSTRRFKLFTFSDLRIPDFRVDARAGGIWVNSSYVEWTVAFYIDTAAEHFIAGLFQDQQCVIASPTHRAEFMIERVETVPTTITGETVRLRTLSPVVIAEKDERGMDQYLHPADELFGPLLVTNLLGKYQSVGLVSGTGQAAELPEVNYRLLPDYNPKSRLLTIKEGSRSQTRIRGYFNFDFELSGPPDILELAVLAGVGRYNAEGFGCVRVLDPTPISGLSDRVSSS